MAAPGDSLTLLFSELIDGPTDQCYMLNMGDAGLLKALDGLSAASASATLLDVLERDRFRRADCACSISDQAIRRAQAPG